MQELTLSDFKFTMPVPTRWNDMDALGHVNNIYYFEYFQIARGHYMMAASPTWDWNKNMFVIAHIECDYYKEITLKHKNLHISVRTLSMSTKSFVMEYVITSTSNDGDLIIHAKGQSVNVLVDVIQKKSTEIEGWLRKDLMRYEPHLK